MAAESNLFSTYYNMTALSVLSHNEQLVTRVQNLVQGEPILEDAVIHKANEKLGHFGVRQESLPTAQLVKLGGYTGTSVVRYAPFHEDMAMVKDSFQIDKDTLDLEGPGKLEQLETDHREAFKQSCARQLLNGDASTSVESFDGLLVRRNTPDNGSGSYSPLSPDPATAAQPGVYDMEGTGSDTFSILFIQWGETKVSVITPPGDPNLGLEEGNLFPVEENDPDDSTKHRTIYRKYTQRRFGLAVANELTFARLRNIENSVSAINPVLVTKINEILGEYFVDDQPVWLYMPPRGITIMTTLMNNKMNVQMSRDNPYRMDMPAWDGRHPIRRCRSMSKTETAVTAV